MKAGRILGLVVEGFEVYSDPESHHIARAVGVWHPRIVVGRWWAFLSPREQIAVLLHEAGHLLSRHRTIRLLCLPFFWTRWAARMCAQQERDADAFAVKHGYGADLLRFVSRWPAASDGRFYPGYKQRRSYIESMIRENSNAVA